MKKRLLVFLLPAIAIATAFGQPKNDFNIIAYYSRGPELVDKLPAEMLTHVIFSFCHLTGNKLTVDNKSDSTTITKLVGLKKRNPNLKVFVSLGGWGGCKSCSDVFSSPEAIHEFSESVRDLSKYFKVDGLDLDWEYPAIEGYPDHPYKPEDKRNFTLLVQDLRKTMGPDYEITFAVGGFQKALEETAEWDEVMKVTNRVHIMSYDLINGNSKATGHHTALYNTPSQKESTDNAVQYLVKIGVPRDKIVIGAAFYARIWENVSPAGNGLYHAGKFKTTANFKDFNTKLAGFTFYWDDIAKAPYAYHHTEKWFATFDDKKSMEIKTRYALDQKLDGIMFWELSHDSPKDGLVETIYKVKTGK